MEGGETHFRWVTYRIQMEPNNPTRIGGCEYVCTRLFGMKGRYNNNNNTAMVPLLSKLMTAGAKGVGGGSTPAALSRACSLSLLLFRRVYVYYINAKRGSFRCSCNMAWAHENFRAHTAKYIHTHTCTHRGRQQVYLLLTLPLPSIPTLRLAPPSSSSRNQKR